MCEDEDDQQFIDLALLDSGIAAMSLPCGLAPEDGLPVGFHIMAPPLADDRLYNVGAALEAALVDRWGHLLIEEAPAL